MCPLIKSSLSMLFLNSSFLSLPRSFGRSPPSSVQFHSSIPFSLSPLHKTVGMMSLLFRTLKNNNKCISPFSSSDIAVITAAAGAAAAYSSPISSLPASSLRCFRSKAALDALDAINQNYLQLQHQLLLEQHHQHPPSLESCGNASSNEGGANLVLYNYPSFSGAFASLFAHLYHSRLRLPFLLLPFSSVDPIRVEDLKLECLRTCYLLDFIGPHDFALQLSRFIPQVIAFDHRKSTLARIAELGKRCPDNLNLRINTEKTSARAAYDYFSQHLSLSDDSLSLLNHEDEVRVKSVLRYIEDADLRQWNLPDVKAFHIGLREERSRLNCLTNPYMFDQLLELDSDILIAKGNSYTCSRRDAAKKLLGKAFKIRLGRGFYGECLGIRADGNSNLSHAIGEELSKLSASAGLRPIGAVVFMQRGNLKICLRSTNDATDTSEIAKAYGGGGKFSSSSFVISMNEYNHWILANSS